MPETVLRLKEGAVSRKCVIWAHGPTLAWNKSGVALFYDYDYD